MVKIEEHAEQMDVKGIIVTMILSAFGFLVALQWRDAIKLTIDLFLPGGEGLVYTYGAAIFVTIIALIITYVLIKFQKANIIPDKYEERLKNGMKKKAGKIKGTVKK